MNAKIVVTGLVGIGILLAVAVLGIRFLGGRAAAPAGAPVPGLPSPPPAPLPTTGRAPDPVSPPAPERAGPPAPSPRSRPGPPAWDAVETALVPAGLGPLLAAPVANGLAEARGRLGPCFAEEKARLETGPPESTGAPPQAYGSAVLVLRMEAQEGRLVVADTEVAMQGHATRPFIECCRRAMKAYEIPAPGVAPPQRYKVAFPLQ